MTAITEQRFSLADRLVDEIELIARVAALTHSQRRSVVRLWLSALDLQREGEATVRDVRQLAHEAGTVELDPDDRLADRLLALQRKVSRMIETTRAGFLAPAWDVRWLACRAERALIAEHRALGIARTILLEHDADCSPVLAERFESAEALLAALEKDAA